ncbi:uncharacterized protein LOC123309932 [Coccinella septempunctata]|uniref:uncharacterized protein LOC123309932 n=1 Tax=Coccinella septempunctata TaxID=41139 RepID=UPI001D09474C|nr:uncharacterized protein LOC123309932 [Coccinella septempunctata]
MNSFVITILACVAAASAAPSLLGPGCCGGTVLIPPSAAVTISRPASILAPSIATIGVAAPWAVAAPVATGVAAITAGGGSIAATGAGAAVRGPPTAPVVIAGPSGKIVADGLWGPTANIGGVGALGAGGW